MSSSQDDAKSWLWALEAIGAARWTWHAASDTGHWDQRFRVHYDLPAEAPARLDAWLERIHPEDQARVRALLERLRITPGDDRWTEVFRSVSAAGGVRWHRSVGKVWRDAAGTLTDLTGLDLDVTTLREVEDAARQREQDLALIVRHYPGIVARLDRGLRYRYVSPRYEEWFGVPASAVLGQTMRDVIGPQAFSTAAPFAQRVLAGEQVTFENRIVLPTGRSWWLEVTFVPLTASEGGVSEFFVFATDVTERKRTETALLESEARFRALAQASSDAVYRMSPDWSEMRQLVGRDFIADTVESSETWLQKYVDEQDQPQVMAAIAEAIRTRRAFELEHRLRRVDGSLGWTFSRAIPMLDAQGSIVEWLGTATDITARKRAEEALQASESRFRTLFDSIEDGFAIGRAVRTADGGVDFCYEMVNPAWQRLTGLRAGEVVGRHGLSLLPALGAAWADTIGRVGFDGESVHIEEFAAPLGKWINAAVSPVGARGEGRLAILLRDVTERRRAEERQAFLLRLREFLASASTADALEQDACQLLARHLRVDRVYVADMDAAPGRVQPLEPFTWALETLRRGECLVVADTRTSPLVPPDDRDVFTALHIVSCVGAPLIKSGRLTAVICATDTAPRTWQTEEVDLMREVGDRIWTAVQRVRAEQRMAERQAALEASETRYRGLAEQIQDGIFVMDADGGLVDANQAGCDLFGLTLSELRATTVRDLLADEEWARAPAQFAALQAGQLVHNEWRFRRKDGTEFIGELIGRQLPDGRSQGVVRDITDRRRTEAAIQALERQHVEDSETLRALLSSAAQGIVSVDEDGTIRSVNPALCTMLGWAPDDLVGQAYDAMIRPEDRDRHRQEHARYWSAPVARPMGRGTALHALRKDGALVPVEISLAPIETARGRAAFAFVTDISDRLRTEGERAARTRELEDQAAMLRRLASQLTLAEQHAREHLAKVIHDHLQQVLFTARLRHQRLSTRLGGAAVEHAELLRQLGHDLDEAVVTTRSLVAELFPPMLHDAGLASALTWLQDWAHQQYGLTVAVHADPAANPRARDIRTLVFQSVKELVFNAVKHAQADRVDIDLALTESGDVRLTVSDGGVGFEPAEVFAPGRSQGTGLGLLAIRERLASFGGRLDIDAMQGRGARLTLTVPRQVAFPSATTRSDAVDHGDTPPSSDVAPPDRTLRIVLADDHALVRDGLRQLLADHPGLDVVGEAADGVEAVALAHALHPDVVIMDVAMPRMDGLEATRLIRLASPHTVVLGLSAQDLPADRHALEAAGAAAYFSKGDDGQRLLAHVLGLQAAGGGLRDRDSS